jgi:hypothetical protein
MYLNNNIRRSSNLPDFKVEYIYIPDYALPGGCSPSFRTPTVYVNDLLLK